ncbi:MAG: DNA replication/repair protein RecF [Myxococcota bacterium]
MHIEHLAVFHFRNLDKLALDLTPRAVVLRGRNAQGKTNLLEAVYVCTTGRSFRNAAPRELLRHGAEKGWIKSRFQRQGVRHDVETHLTSTQRSIRVDGRSLRQASRLLELVNVVAFFPDDLRIVKGSPEERRRFLDRAVANYRPEMVDAATAYAKALRSRNALLRAESPPSADMLAAYDDQLVHHGEVIHRCRCEGLAALAPLAAARFAAMMPDVPPLALRLESGVPGDDDALFDGSFGERLREALAKSYPRDRARGATSVGAHRADLVITLDVHSARAFASQGQQRAMVVALKLAELQCLTEQLDSPPILLLDDVSSELDAERTRLLFSELEKTSSQVWVSTTGAVELPLPGDAQIFEVDDGRINAV